IPARSSGSVGTTPGTPDTEKLSVARISAKTLHLLVLGWTVFMLFFAVSGFMKTADTMTASAAAAVGATIGMGFLALMWLIPVVGMEIIAIAAATSAGSPIKAETHRREWKRALFISAVPNGILLLAVVSSGIGQVLEVAGSRRAVKDSAAVDHATAPTPVRAPALQSVFSKTGDAKTPDPKSTIALTVLSKSYIAANPSAHRYQDSIILKCSYENLSERSIRAFKGKLEFTDLFGAPILTSDITVNQPVAPGKTATWTGEIHYNQFISEQVRFRNTDLKDMKVNWHQAGVIYGDDPVEHR
ncbi:MAG TPA: hypothetical protein VNZ26_16725, partial [Vicinamibacterales bacterium]|nr:hypothetical protein [Vicinamibacterales bacterium]